MWIFIILWYCENYISVSIFFMYENSIYVSLDLIETNFFDLAETITPKSE